MQYPIIDLITDAYINNGWTGLDIIEGTNLINVESLPVSLSGVNYFSFPVNSELITYGENNDITVKLVGTLGENKTRFALFIYDTINNEALFVGNSQHLTPDDNFTLFGTFHYSSSLDLTKNLTIRIYAQPYEGSSSSTITGLMIAKGHVDEYVPYTPPTTDISNRLKLPLPHYFPHPVIDALQRAAAGTQTADDTEILRHYLTPLGIGGI